ncbi:hypothetical protein GPECTOR_37g195 [Gonium pectorale]|uniref:BTB domain-containing protein n=1 Tax=Gonium pectorale TaxID=33097 RepID=A0A150GBI1_GONPE|nr:hypothetical protein GPECTOR_37g195 [Gonium pectorale]|eukprot:KXZ47189.1 hypothetical protein GPECTOR_37g195 [Gonium pectorale]
MTAVGAGTLFVVDDGRIRRVQLPQTWLAPAGAADPAAPGPGSGAVGAEEVAVVTTLAAPVALEPRRLCYISDGGKDLPPAGALVVSSSTALYRLPLGVRGAELAPWVGQEGEGGARDGPGPEARFCNIVGLAAGGDGCVYVLDMASDRRGVDPSGAVTTIASGLDVSGGMQPSCPTGTWRLSGVLARFWACTCWTWVCHPAGHRPAPTPSRPLLPAARTLPGDLAALLERQPDGTADLEVVVGDRTFHVHRALVAARSDYFRQLLGGGFAEDDAARLSLPDTDPQAFALVLRFLYSGAVDVPAAQVRPLAELVDRLLLPELCRDAQERLLAAVGPESVVDAMLWAEARGPCFTQLLAELKAWCLEHYQEVLRLARDSMERLSAAMPSLMAELVKGYVGRPAKWPSPRCEGLRARVARAIGAGLAGRVAFADPGPG